VQPRTKPKSINYYFQKFIEDLKELYDLLFKLLVKNFHI